MGLIGRLLVKLGLDSSEFQKGTKDAQNTTESFGDKIKGMAVKAAAAIGVLSLLKKAFDFGKEAYAAAAQAEGVERAFTKLNNPQLLSELRDATRGTVSDLELMQNAIQAKNFKIPLENLATYLKFAHQRAKDTGQSVDYLVNSIVIGVGRKSPLILDNLGISALEVREEFAKTGDMAKAVSTIIQREMGDADDAMDESKEKIGKATSAWENFKVSFGKSGIIKSVGDELNSMLSTTLNTLTAINNSDTLGWWDKLLGYMGHLPSQYKAIDEQLNKEWATKNASKVVDEMMQEVKTLEQAELRLASIIRTTGKNGISQEWIRIYKGRLEEYISQQKAMKIENEQLSNTRAGLEKELADKQEQLKSVKIGSKEETKLHTEIALLEKKMKVVNKTTEASKTLKYDENKNNASIAQLKRQETAYGSTIAYMEELLKLQREREKYAKSDAEYKKIKAENDALEHQIELRKTEPKTERQIVDDRIKSLEQQQLEIPISIGTEEAQYQFDILQAEINELKNVLKNDFPKLPEIVPPEGSIAAYDVQLAKLAEAYANATNEVDRHNIALEQLEWQTMRNAMTGDANSEVQKLRDKAEMLGLLADRYRTLVPILGAYYGALQMVALGEVKAAENAKKQTENVVDFASQLTSQMGSALASSLGSLFEGLFDGSEEKTAQEKTQAVLAPFADMVVQLGEYAIAMGVAGIALENLTTNPYLALAAGVALLALGKVAQAGIANITGGKGGSASNPTNFTGGYSNGSSTSVAAMQLASPQPQLVVLETRVSGSDLLLVQGKEQTRRSR